MDRSTYTTLVPLAIAVLVVLRFAFRELRERVVKLPWIWVRPALFLVLTVYLIVLTVSLDARDAGEMLLALALGAVAGALTGIGVIRNTTFTPAGIRGAVRMRGSQLTLAIWIGALALRLIARYTWPHGANPRSQLPLNCGTLALVAVAFTIIAATTQAAIGRQGPPLSTGGSSAA